MAVFAGNSGNIILQVKGVNVTTKSELYHHNGEVYGKFDNETKLINFFPDQIKEIIRERIQLRLNNTNITLNENGEYEYHAKKEAKFLGLFKIRERVSWNIDPETGEILKEKKPWWGFLTRDSKVDDTLLGESCGTVTPGYNDECCQNKGYDYWNAEEQECGFNS